MYKVTSTFFSEAGIGDWISLSTVACVVVGLSTLHRPLRNFLSFTCKACSDLLDVAFFKDQLIGVDGIAENINSFIDSENRADLLFLCVCDTTVVFWLNYLNE